ncbi:MAG TPA: DUF4380 domain-containing protein [Polyangiaceae bacterium]|nr:DUF4380 domain-containing protein [Polyangiaceae bacterium]
MKHHNILSVPQSALFLACFGLAGCSSSDPAPVTPAGGAQGVGGNSAGGTSATSKNANGGTKATSKSDGEGGAVDSGGTGDGGTGDGGTGDGGTGDESGGSSPKGGASAKGGSSSKGGTSSKGSTTPEGGEGGATEGGEGGTDAGGAPATAIEPTKVSDTDYRFEMKGCDVVMDVNPKIGGRITKLALGGKAIITAHTATTYDKNATNNSAGSTYWTSPQKAWPDGSWPPIAEIDGNAYSPAIQEKTHLVMTGSANSTLGASVTKDFSVDDSSCWINLLFTLKATKAMSAGPWQITRVPRGGLAFFPVGDSSKYKPGPLQEYTVNSSSQGVAWFDDSKKAATSESGEKLIADGADGWLAYALGGNLFVKKYVDVKPASFAEAEGDIEIYPGSGYTELEVQGAYTSLAKDGTLPWTVQWKVVKIPSDVTVASESETLLAFVKDLVAK